MCTTPSKWIPGGGGAVTAEEDTTVGAMITIEVITAMAAEMVMTKVAMDVATTATTRYSRPAVMTRTRGMLP